MVHLLIGFPPDQGVTLRKEVSRLAASALNSGFKACLTNFAAIFE